MKKLNLLKPLLLFGFLGLCSTACNDDDGHVPMPDPEVTCRLTFINLPDEMPEGTQAYYTGIEYNSKGYVSKVYQILDTDEDKIEFSYGSDTVVIKAEEYVRGELDSYSTFSYTNNLLTSITEYNLEGQEYDIPIFTYDSKKRMIKEIYGASNYDFTITYTYDNKDNLTKREELRGGELIYREVYENYDNHHTPYSGVKGLPGFYFESYSKNNPGKLTTASDINSDGIIEPGEQKVITYTYTYNSHGYPTKITTGSGEYTHTNTFTYACD